MAAIVGATAPAPQTSRTGTQSNGLTSNMAALRRYHRKAYACAIGSLALAGTVTASTSSTAVTGTGTKFTRDLQVGSKLMKTDGTTLIGYVASIASDTLLTLLVNAAVTQSALGATVVPRLAMLNFGDSVATLKNQHIIPILWRALGDAGRCGQPGQNLGGTYTLLTTVTVTYPASPSYDYTYNPTGSHAAIAANGALSFGISGATYTGNLFAAYLVQGPGQGVADVDLTTALAGTVTTTTSSTSVAGTGTTFTSLTAGQRLFRQSDGAYVGAIASITSATALTLAANAAVALTGAAADYATHSQAGIDLGTGFSSVSLKIVKFATGTAIARKLRVGSASGTVVMAFSPSLQNTNLRGLHLVDLSRGGLQHADILSCANPQLVAAWIADLKPDIATYEMREGTYANAVTPLVTTTLPSVISMLMTSWSDIDWLFYGQTPGAQDAGLAQAAAPSWRENEDIRAYALSQGYAFFDSFTPFGSYETIMALDPSFDGNHVGLMLSHYAASLVLRQFGLTTFALLPAAPAALNTGKALAQHLGVSKNQDNYVTQEAGYFDTDTFGLDLYGRLQRWFSFTDQGGTSRAMFVSPSVANGVGVIMAGPGGSAWLNDATRYNAYDWSIQVSSAGVVTLKGKDGSGTFKSLALGTMA